MTSEPMTHDFGPGRRSWGHDYCINKVHDGGQRVDASGWGHDGKPIQEGDYLILDKGAGRATRYQVQKVERVMDPRTCGTRTYPSRPGNTPPKPRWMPRDE